MKNLFVIPDGVVLKVNGPVLPDGLRLVPVCRIPLLRIASTSLEQHQIQTEQQHAASHSGPVHHETTELDRRTVSM
jgi:hypothetical protein